MPLKDDPKNPTTEEVTVTTDAKSEYHFDKERGIANSEDFHFNRDSHNIDVATNNANVYSRYDSSSKVGEPISIAESIQSIKAKNKENLGVILDVFRDKKTEYFKYGIYSNDIGNEDPTILGFDIFIDTDSSPLFNGELTEFLNSFSDIPEVKNRKGNYEMFKAEFNKYFYRIIEGEDFSAFKAHYIQSVSGLDKLTESISGGSFNETHTKQFTDYGKDLITIKINEDVTLNTSHLALLYRSLMWSRINGRMIIPENLLRFDMFIQISEIRNFNTVKKQMDQPEQNLGIIKANVSRYLYRLYDCQLIFDKLPHGDSTTIDKTDLLTSYDFSIKYKFSTVEFERFMQQNDLVNRDIGADPNDMANRYSGWNSYTKSARAYIGTDDQSPTSISSSGKGDNSNSDGTMSNRAQHIITSTSPEIRPYKTLRPGDNKLAGKSKDNTSTKSEKGSDKKSELDELKKKSLSSKAVDILKEEVGGKTGLIQNMKRAALMVAQMEANKLVALVNMSFNKLINSAGLGKNIRNPDNVYDKVNPFEQAIKQQFIKFGNSTINSIFGNGIDILKKK